MSTSYRLLQAVLVLFGAVALLLYPLATVWPSGWAWHHGAAHDSQYFMMIVGIYVTLGAFLLNAARHPERHLSLIWFTVWSSVVHALVMAVQSLADDQHTAHLWGDVPGLLVGAIALALLTLTSGIRDEPVAGRAT